MALYRWHGNVLTEWTQLQDKMDSTKKEWDTFMRLGRLSPEGKLAPEIFSSWQRCRDRGMNPHDDTIPVLSREELESRLAANKKLIELMRPVLQETADSIKDSGFQMDLYDRDLYLLMRFGKKIREGDNERREVIPGECHKEKCVGTTSTNLAALLEKPMQVVAFEHYRTIYHDLTCISVPIMNQARKLIFVLTVEGWSWPLHKHTMGLLTALKYSIEYRLSQNPRHDLEFPAKINHEVIELIEDAVVVVDGNGKISLSNKKADKCINTGWKSVTGFSCETVWGPRNPFLEVLKRKTPISSRDVILEVDAKPKNFMGTVKPILGDDGKLEGAIGVFKDLNCIKNGKAQSGKPRAHYTFENLVGESTALKKAVQLAKETANMHNNVLIQGESGTGKELFAQSIHNESQYCNGPFVAVNCSAIPHFLLESELFGYEPGAFTGAKKEGGIGKFEQAAGGTIFLDEINSMSLDMQAKILRVIQNKTITRIGGTEDIPVNVRIIAATNADLWQMVKKEEFREDLYYRINVISIYVPPLRERTGDIELLIEYLLFKLSNHLKQQIEIDYAAVEVLKNYSWPGNVRELENVLERSWVLARSNNSRIITLKEVCSYRGIEENLRQPEPIEQMMPVPPANASGGSLNEVENEMIKKALAANRGNILATAQQLGIARNTLYRKIKRYDIKT
jgi:transcriptional regulator with PAS, ATPase and Fis domain